MKRRKFKQYIVLAINMICFAFLIISGMSVFSRNNKKRITEQNRKILTESANRLSKNLTDEFQIGMINIQNLAQMLSRSLSSPNVDISYLQALLANSFFDFIEFADVDGMDHNITGSVSDARDRQYYLDAKDGNCGMELIVKSRATFETLYMLYSPVYFNGDFVGSLVGVYQAKNRMRYLLTTDFYGEKASSYLCTKDGRIVGTSDALDTTEELYIQDICCNSDLTRNIINDALKNEQTAVFNENEFTVGGVIQKIPIETDIPYFAVHCFPQSVNDVIIKSSSKQVTSLIWFSIAVYVVLGFIVIILYSKQQKQVEAADNAKSVFLLNMSHDIRTPMNAILGFNALATKNIDNKEKVLEYHKKINSAGENLLSLINNVLDMSRIETGKTVITQEDYNIVTIIEEIVTILQPQFEKKNITFNVETSLIYNPYIKCDKVHLTQILLNLLGNAQKFTPEGGRVDFGIKQILGVEEKNKTNDIASTFCFTIKDNGIGIEQEFLKRIYEPFERERSSVVNKIQGTGIGLSITKHLVDLMDGSIAVESKPGFGTEFTVTITFAVSTEELAKQTLIKELPADLLRGKSILIADDNEFNVEITTELLKDQNCIVKSVENGYEAVRAIQDSKPGDYDLILMDIQMPVMNGISASKTIRNLDSPVKDIPIVAVTANVFEEDIRKSLEAGINAFVSKPVKIEELIKTMYDILKSRGEEV